METRKRSNNPRNFSRAAGDSNVLCYQDSLGSSQTKKLSSSPITSRRVFSRGAIVSWGKSIGISPDDALNFMQSEGVVITDDNDIPSKVTP
jgi:hypothetical protein